MHVCVCVNNNINQHVVLTVVLCVNLNHHGSQGVHTGHCVIKLEECVCMYVRVFFMQGSK